MPIFLVKTSHLQLRNWLLEVNSYLAFCSMCTTFSHNFKNITQNDTIKVVTLLH